MAYICLKPPGSCQNCVHFRYDEDYQEKACFAAMDDLVTNKTMLNKGEYMKNWYVVDREDEKYYVCKSCGHSHDVPYAVCPDCHAGETEESGKEE